MGDAKSLWGRWLLIFLITGAAVYAFMANRTIEHPWGVALGQDLKGGSRPEDLFRSVSTGLDGTPMPGFGYLTAEQRWGVAYFILSLNK